VRARLTFNEHVDPKLRETLQSNFVSFALVTPCDDGNRLIIEVTRPTREKRLWASLNSYEQAGFIKYEPLP
jgi:hypothetical protein